MDLAALRHVSNGQVVFHNGLWGPEMCYMWASPEPGRGRGRVSPAETQVLDSLIGRALIKVQPGHGATDVPVVLTEKGREYLCRLEPGQVLTHTG
jgi:hypothetical protein